MLRKRSLISLLAMGALYAEQTAPPEPMPHRSPEEIALDLQANEERFQAAQEMFIPWYTGPLIASSANNVPKGKVNIQGYLYLTINYALFDKERHSHMISPIYLIKPLFVAQWGITKWLDVTLIPQGVFRWRKGDSYQNFGDTSLQFGFQAYKETEWIPSVRFVLGEVFPTGRYQGLSAHKHFLDATGAGAFSTVVGLNLSKVFWWDIKHPIAARLTMSETIPDNRVHVEGFNSYGGGYTTDGKVQVGNTFSGDVGLEVSITQKWVFAIDLAYTYSSKSSFSGTKGFVNGSVAAVGAPSSDQLSIAPAFEYNVTNTGGFIGGVWFPITGRNSFNFFSAIASYTQIF